MRLPLDLQVKLGKYLFRQRMRGEERYPLVLMLEPLHACNFTCPGCGRIREYSTSLKDIIPLEECLASVDECPAPVVSICGGEPTMYPKIAELVQGILDRDRYIYLCTNAILLERKMARFPVDRRLIFNIHLDGLEETHDKCVNFPGSFRACVSAIRAAKRRGHRVCTNTTIFQETDVEEIRRLFDFLTELGVDGILVSPAYSYSAVQDKSMFLSRAAAEAKFRMLLGMNGEARKWPIWNSVLYLDFLRGFRDFRCTAWTNPTRNIQGWRMPCYPMADGHVKTFRELMEDTPWEKYGRGSGDPRCEDCMIHCGYEGSAVQATQSSLRDAWKMFRWNFFS